MTTLFPATMRRLTRIGPSTIHGKGLFAGSHIGKGIPVARVFNFKGKQTRAGLNTNHSKAPSAYVRRRGRAYYLISKHRIRKGSEITADYGRVHIPESSLVGVPPNLFRRRS